MKRRRHPQQEDEQGQQRPFIMISTPSTPASQMEKEDSMEERSTSTSKKSTGLIIVGGVIVVVLIIAGLLLPPISLGDRLFGSNDEPTAVTEGQPQPTNEAAPADTNGGGVTAPESVALAVSDGTSVAVSEQSPADFQASNAAAATPANKAILGNVYTLSYDGAPPVGQIAIPLTSDMGDGQLVDLYGWDGANWRFLPSTLNTNEQKIATHETELPQAITVMQRQPADEPLLGALVNAGDELAPDMLPYLAEVSAGSLKLAANGALEGELAALPTGGYNQFARVTNVGALVDQTNLTNLLADPALQASHIAELVTIAADYAGINLDYQGVTPQQRDVFTQFVSDLATALHEQGKRLAVSLATPEKISTGQWESVGQDWSAIGQTADLVYAHLPYNPTQYDQNEDADNLLTWATRQIPREKLSMVAYAQAVDRIGESFLTMSNEAALVNFGELQFVQGSDEVAPETAVEVALSGNASPLEWDGDSLTYKYSYEMGGQTHHVWLNNAASFANQLQLARLNNLRGVIVQGLPEISDVAGYTAALSAYMGEGELPQPAGAAIVWSVRGDNDSVLASNSGDDLTFTWEGSPNAGNYTINAEFAIGENLASLGNLTLTVADATESEPVAEAETEEEADEEETTTAEPTPAITVGDADGVVTTGANIRIGPGLGYGTIAGGAEAGTRLTVLGRNDDNSWLNIRMPDGATEGWIFSSLVQLASGLNIASLPVVEAPALTASTGGTDGGGNTGGSAPPPVSVAPITNRGFELGGQIFGSPYGMMSYAGMTWAKRQYKWSPGGQPSDVAGMITEAHNAGFKILLSIPGVHYPTSLPDFAAYTEFLRGVASLPDPPDAIEVWNEMNIDAEWPVGHISPSSYVNNMLAPAYNAIKGANPNIMVISGGPAPTGYFGGGCSTSGCDDAAYVAGMAAAGAGSYMDCIGIHYNEGIISPNQRTGDPRSEHYTRYFWGMVDAYYNAFGGKPLCFTELGYLTGDGYGSLPSNFAWAGNTTVAQQAQWLAEAASLSASSGKVRLMVVWNVDSTTWTSDPQAGFAMIRPGGGCPACESLRQVMGQ